MQVSGTFARRVFIAALAGGWHGSGVADRA
jgi:hypothetical protein